MKVYGFSCLKNGIRFDYPFHESWSSLAPLVDETVIAFDDGDDDSRSLLKTIPKVRILEREWPTNVLNGHSISMMTNFALEELRRRHAKQEEPAWAILLQADEVLSESDSERILADIQAAEDGGYDCIRFRYLHFWQSHFAVAREKRWYPQEIRAIRLHTPILNHGDGQTFENYEKPYDSDAYIYHYGHVRDAKKYHEKTVAMRKMYYKGVRLQRKLLKVHLGKTEKTLRYLGPHPKIMMKRIARMENLPAVANPEILRIKGRRECFSTAFLESLRCGAVEIIESYNGLGFQERRQVVDMAPSTLERLLYDQAVVHALDSDFARPWSTQTQCLFALSRKGFGVRF